jgi:hypothetical protein
MSDQHMGVTEDFRIGPVTELPRCPLTLPSLQRPSSRSRSSLSERAPSPTRPVHRTQCRYVPLRLEVLILSKTGYVDIPWEDPEYRLRRIDGYRKVVGL